METEVKEDRANFVENLSEALADFWTDSLFGSTHFSFFRSGPRVFLGRENVAPGKVALLLQSIETSGKPEDELYRVEENVSAGNVVCVTTQEPWPYRLTYALIGASLGTSEGMNFAGKAQAILFDHPKLPSEYLSKRNVEFLSTVTLRPTNGSKSERWEDSELGCVAAMHAEFMFATGTPVAVDQRVARRVLRLGMDKPNNKTRENQS